MWNRPQLLQICTSAPKDYLFLPLPAFCHEQRTSPELDRRRQLEPQARLQPSAQPLCDVAWIVHLKLVSLLSEQLTAEQASDLRFAGNGAAPTLLAQLPLLDPLAAA